MASADAWCCDPHKIERCREAFGSFCEEMEAAAIASVCASYGTPFLCVKDISNNELHAHTGGDDGSYGLANVMSQIGLRASCVVEALLSEMGQQQQIECDASLQVPGPPELPLGWVACQLRHT